MNQAKCAHRNWEMTTQRECPDCGKIFWIASDNASDGLKQAYVELFVTTMYGKESQ